jgi:uncharacterized protein DUF4013
MSYVPPSGPNPYASPNLPPARAVVPAGPAPTSMEYMRAYNYIFENPAWITTILLLGVIYLASMIPGVGILLNLLFLGYAFEVIDMLMKSNGRQYPTFEFGRFGDYLGRGLWPFLVSLVATVVLIPVVYIGLILVAVTAAGAAAAGGDNLGPVLGGLVGIVGIVAFSIFVFVASCLLTGMILRSGLAQDFAAGFQFSWIMDFIRKMWVEMLLAGLFLFASALVLEVIGLLALCVGLFFVLPLVLMAYAHLAYQLYAVYLSRGGTPVSIKLPPVYVVQPPAGYQPPPA